MGFSLGEGFYFVFIGKSETEIVSNSLEIIAMTNGNVEKLNAADIIKIVEGILIGFTKNAPGTLGTCIGDVEKIGKKLVEAVKDFKEDKYIKAKEGIVLVGEAIKMIPDLVDNC